MEYLELKNMEYLELSNLDNIELSNMEYLKLSNMDYLELPDGSSSYLHSLKSRKTLWEINNEPQMYEVEILHENNEDFDTNFDDILNMNRVHCSICNLDVPKTHIKQHNKTTIHQNLMKLTDEVLERTKRHLKTNEGQTNASLNVTDTFFCEICSKLIQNNNINDHMESKFHKKQELFEKLLNLFIETYLRVNEEVEFDLEDIQVFIDSNESSLLKHRTLGYPNNISKDLSQNLRETHVSKVPSDIAKARSQSPRERPVSKVPSDIAKAQSQSPRERPVSKVPSDIAKARSQSPCERPVSKVPSDIAKARSQSPREKPVSKVPSDIAKARSQSTCERPVSKVPSDISKDPSEIENPCETPVSKVPSDTTKDPVINIFDPNYLKELLESGKNESSSAESQIWKIVKKRSLSTSRTSVDTSKKDTTSGQDDVSKDTKSEPTTKHTNLNPNTPSFYPMNSNLNPTTPSFNPNSPSFNPTPPSFNHMYPNFNHMAPSFNYMYPNFNYMAPNFNHMYPNFNHMYPNFNHMYPNFNPMNPNFYPMNPNFNPMNPHFHHMNPMWNPNNQNFNPMNPMWNPNNPNLNNKNLINSNTNPMNHRHKMNSNSNTMKPTKPNLDPINPNTIDPNLNLKNPNLTKPNSDPMNSNSDVLNPNSNPIKPNLDPINPNSNSTNLNLNLVKPNSNPIKSNLEAVNPNSSTMISNLNPINPNSGAINPNSDSMNPDLNPIKPDLDPMKPTSEKKNAKNLNTVKSNSNLVNPNLNHIKPNSYTMNPNLITMHPHLNCMHPHINFMHPHINFMHPNINPMHPNLNPINPYSNPMNPNLNTMNPNLNPMNPNFNPMYPNINPMDPQHKLGPNLNPMEPQYKSGPNFNFNAHEIQWNKLLHTPDPQFKLGSNFNFNTLDPQFKSGSNSKLNILDPVFKLGSNCNLNTPDPQFKLRSNCNLNTLDRVFKLGSNCNLNRPDPQFKSGSNFKLNTPDPVFKLGSNCNLNTPDPQFKLGSNCNLNTLDPVFKLGSNCNLNTPDPQFKLGSNCNLNTLDPVFKLGSNCNLNTPDPQFKSGSNFKLNPLDPVFKLNSNSNLKTPDPQFKLGSNCNLNTLDPKFKFEPNLNKTDLKSIPAETKILIKTINKAERKREQQIKNIKAFEEFSSYIKTIQDKYPSKGFKIEAVTSLKVKITALNGDCVLVSRNHFQSNDGKYCRVCQNGNLSADHEMSEEHISRIMVPVVDKNCIREIDDIWSHCIICNILIKFVEDHNRTALHLRKLKKSFIDIPKQPVENKPKTIISEEKGNHIQHTEKENEEEKRVNTQEKKATFKFDIDKFSNTLADKLLPLFAKYAKTKEDANENNHNGTSEPDNRNTVEVAKEINEVKQLKESIQTMVDQDYKSLTEVPQFDDEEASNTSNTSKYIIKYCSICRTHVHDYEAHKLSNTHTENNNRTKELRKMITRNNLKEIKDLDLLNCEMCDVNINFNTEDTEEHVNSQLHKCNYFKFIRYNKIILIDQIESQCEPCNKAIHRSNIFDHCKQEKHIKKLKDLIHITSNQTKPNQTKKELKTKTTDNKIIQNDDVKKLLYHYRAQDVEFLCKICHALISRDAAKGHSESKQHKEKYNTLLNSNKIIKTITGSFYCELCDVQIPMTGEITHVFGKNHIDNSILKAKVAKNESNAAILIKAIVNPVAGPSTAPVPSTSKEIPIKGKLEMNVPLYVKYQYKVPSEGLPICLICEKKVRNSDITNHVLSTTHNINFNLMMINNTIKIKGNMYICVCCNTSVPLFGELEHILGKLHSKNKINLPIASVGTDMLTYDHVLNLTQGKRMVKY